MDTIKNYVVMFTLCTWALYAHAVDGTGSVTSGGITRTFTYHAPGLTVAPNLPVMIVMHGDGGTGASIQTYTGFDATADTKNFIAIYPDAVGGSWNRYVDNVPGDAGLGNPGAPDDVLFIADLIDYLCSNYHINPNKVYATGHSAGGFMAYHLAIMLPNKIAAFAPVSASLWGDNAFITNYFTNTYVPVPICHIHGDADVTVDYPDPDFMPTAYSEYPLTAFSPPNCGNTTYTGTTTLVAGVQSINFCDGTGTTNKKVELVRIMGMAHAWPSVAGFDANAYIWDFCNGYSLTTGTVCSTNVGVENEGGLTDVFLFPIPANDQINIGGFMGMNAELKVVDAMGREVFTKRDFNQTNLDIKDWKPGVYFCQILAGAYSKQIKFVKD